MKKKAFLVLALALVVALCSCGQSPQDSAPADANSEAAAAKASLDTSWTATPEPSNTPEPSATPEPTVTPKPSPTPIVLPDVLNETFTGISVIYRDDFDFVMQGMNPEGWESNDPNLLQSALRETKDSNVRIFVNDAGTGNGILFYYPQEVINPGKGVYLTFKYTGTRETFTWGIDNINADGEVYEYMSNGYYSVAMQMMNSELSAHIIQNAFQGDGYFQGDLRLQEETWYSITLAFDEEENYIIKIWETDAPENQLVYIRNWPDFPEEYYFISWMSATRTLWMDEFTIFSFDSIILEE